MYRKSTSTHKELIFNVQLGINPKRKNWVLFENGTYIMFPDGYTDAQMKGAAIKFLKEYDEKAVSVQKSNFAKGWIATTGKGLYNYIDPSSLGKGIHKQSVIKAQGRDNLLQDKKELKIVHVNSSTQNNNS